jgi:hypothetical protein
MSTSFPDRTRGKGSQLVRFVGRAAVIGLVMIAALVVGTGWIIGSGVHAASRAALAERPGDPVPALIAYVESPTHTLQARARAVWALGQLGDARALPALEKHLTGKACEHDRALCQYELRKAIRLCRGSTNMLAFTWR